jgi:hypothetical protein
LDSSEAAAWFAWKLVPVSKDTKDKQPLGDLCLPCGTFVESHPEVPKPELVERAKSDRRFRAELMLIGDLLQHGDMRKPFRPALVQLNHTIGMKISRRVAIVNVEDFMAHEQLGMNPEKLGITAMLSRSFSYQDDDGKDKRGIAMNLKDLPSDLPHSIGEMYTRTESFMAEIALQPSGHYRNGQGIDNYVKASNDMLAARAEPLKQGGVVI